jgi:hypothetical protein
VRQLPVYVTLVFVALKLAGVVTWSWWWVLAPMWIGALVSVLLAGALIIVWCLALWLEIVVNGFRFRRRRQSPVFFDSDSDPDVAES